MRRHTAIPFLSSINLGEWQELAAIWQLRAKATGPHRLWPDSTTGFRCVPASSHTALWRWRCLGDESIGEGGRGGRTHAPATCLWQSRRWIISPTQLCGAWLAVAVTVGEQWRLGRHSPTRCPVSFELGFTPEDHWRPVTSAAESCVNGHFCLRLDFTRTVSDKFLEFLFRNNQGPIPTRGTPDVSLMLP